MLTPLPPLPLRNDADFGPALFVDNSMLELLTTCPRALLYNKFFKRVAAVSKPSLNFGSAIHLALEHRYKTYKNMSPDPMLHEELASLLGKFFAEHPPEEGEYRNYNWALEIIRRYNDKYAIEPFQLLQGEDGKVKVELPFALPLFTYRLRDGNSPAGYIDIPVIYTGRIDLPVLWDDQLFVIDHKTTSMLGISFSDGMKMSAQQKGYAWALQTLTGQKVAGYCINAIRVKEPPQYLLDPNSPRKGKQTVHTWWEESLCRERYFLRDGELEEWKFNAIAIIKEMFYHYEQGYFPMKTAWCNKFGRCAYFDVCSLPVEDRGILLESGNFMENTWNPLAEPTDSLQ